MSTNSIKSDALEPTRAEMKHLSFGEKLGRLIPVFGLPILALEPDLDRYYYDSVIGGPGAFMVPAQTYETFGDAILKKLITEIAANGR